MSFWLRIRWPLDRVIAALLLLPAAPVIGALAFFIRRHDSGPGIVRLTRIGRHGRPFSMLKLRTMYVRAPDARAGGNPITAPNDDRITALGTVLRRNRLDELPQLVNVVRGEMALIGPRPETPEYVDLSDVRWQDVLRARPGIAGSTQLVIHEWEERRLACDSDAYGRVVVGPKLALDGWYVANASPRFDAVILVSLVQRFLLRSRTLLLEKAVPPDLVPS